MADTKISDLVELGGASLDDLLVIVDVDDTSMATSGTNKKIKASNVTGLLAPLAGGEVSVTGATTATVSRMHVCRGTTANYTVTLPPASGNLGTLIGFRMAAELTKLVTLDGNASETIDGALTRVLWAGETAILLCDGSNWFKVAGRPIPMQGTLAANAAQSLTLADFTWINLPVSEYDVGSITDAANNRFVLRRDGKYDLTLGGEAGGAAAGAACIFSVTDAVSKSSELRRIVRGSTDSGGFLAGAATVRAALSAGQILKMTIYIGGTGAVATNYASPLSVCRFTVTEVPAW